MTRPTMPMRKLASILLIALLLGTALTGCLSSADEEGDDLNAGEENPDQESPTAPPDNRTGEMAAFRETNKTEEGSGGMAHDHDYWQGRSRVNLFETTAEMPPAPDSGPSSVVFRPPQPHLVFEGTAHIEITISNPQRHACYPYLLYGGEFICTSNSDHWAGAGPGDTYTPEPRDLPPMEVEFLHGASNPDDWIAAGTIEWDTPFQIEVEDPMWTDMPHATASLWAFRFTSPGPMDGTLVFDVTMDIVRSDADEIPVWPGHPDFYAEQNHRKVLDAPGYTRDEGLAGSSLVGIASPEVQPVRPEKLISYGTNTLHVWVNITNVNAPAGEPDGWFMMWTNATHRGQQYTDDMSKYPGTERELYWVVPVTPDAMDTPYATESRWEFEVGGIYLNCIGNCVPYEVEYNIAIVATNEVLPEEEYDLIENW